MLSRFLPSSARLLQPQRLAAQAPATNASAAQSDSVSAQWLEALLYRSEGFVEDLGPGYASRLDPQFNPAGLRL
ncbi:hypothetical protein [Variovorax sp. HJSM1_2]|uniref:hypothetical protein n=1 Tax=Variovorax sp. HJSM1_2 TaxID=3366263 RepID=UPI003BDD6C75